MKNATLKIRYIYKMLTMPKGTKFEYMNKPVSRFTYIRETLKLFAKM